MQPLKMRGLRFQVGDSTVIGEFLLTSINRLGVQRKVHLHRDCRQRQPQSGLQGVLLPVGKQSQWSLVPAAVQMLARLIEISTRCVQYRGRRPCTRIESHAGCNIVSLSDRYINSFYIRSAATFQDTWGESCWDMEARGSAAGLKMTSFWFVALSVAAVLIVVL